MPYPFQQTNFKYLVLILGFISPNKARVDFVNTLFEDSSLLAKELFMRINFTANLVYTDFINVRAQKLAEIRDMFQRFAGVFCLRLFHDSQVLTLQELHCKVR